MDEVKKKFAITAAIATLISTAGFLIAPVEVRFINTLTDNPTYIGLTFAIGSFSFAALSFYLGRLSDRIGRGRLIIWGIVVGVFTPILFAFSANVFQYMGVKFVWAFSGVAAGPILSARLHDIIKGYKHRGQLMGIYSSIGAITGSFGAFIGGWVSESFSFQTAYFIMAGLALVAAVIAATQLKNKEVIKKYVKRPLLFSVHYILKKPPLIYYAIINTGYRMSWNIKPLLWPLIIFGIAGSDTITGSIFATMGFTAFLILPWVGKYIDKSKSFFPSSVTSFLILGVMGLILALTDTLWLFWVAAGLYALGEAIYGPTQSILLNDHVESEYRGELLAFDSIYDRVIDTGSAFVAGVLLNFLLPQNVLLIYVLIFWLTLAIIFPYYKKRVQPYLFN